MPRLRPKRTPGPAPAPTPLPVFAIVPLTQDFTFEGARFSAGMNLSPTDELLELCSLYPEHLTLTTNVQLLADESG